MGRIEGTGPKREPLAKRIPRPRFRVRGSAVAVVAVLVPVVLTAPEGLVQAVAAAGAVAAAWVVGRYDGRAEYARELLLDVDRRDG